MLPQRTSALLLALLSSWAQAHPSPSWSQDQRAEPLAARELEPTDWPMLHGLPESAYGEEIRYQPMMDFDTDSCYNVPAIDSEGKIDEGQNWRTVSYPENCRQVAALSEANAYSRGSCIGQWCAFVYAYYFPQNQGEVDGFNVGWTGDFQHVVVWKNWDGPHSVALSTPNGHEIKPAGEVLVDHLAITPDGQSWNPKVVHHKLGDGLHGLRFANSDDDDHIENDSGEWISNALVGWDNGFPSEADRDALCDHGFWKGFDLKDEHFRRILVETMPAAAYEAGSYFLPYKPDDESSSSTSVDE